MFEEYCIDTADDGGLICKVAQTFLEIFKQPLAVNTKLYERESELGTFFSKGKVTCTLNYCTPLNLLKCILYNNFKFGNVDSANIRMLSPNLDI